MKTILIATDFSDNAKIAADYAVNLAQHFKSSIVLFHAIALPYTEETSYISVADLMLEDAKEAIENLKQELLKKDPQLTINTEVAFGEPVNCINEFYEKAPFDIAVVGNKGKTGLEEILLGSVATSIIANAQYPVLLIPENFKYTPIKQITFATDYTAIKNKDQIITFLKIAEGFNANTNIIKVITNKEENTSLHEKQVTLEGYFKTIPHQFLYINNPIVKDGINTFLANNKTDLLVMIARKHSFLHRLFNKSETKLMANSVKIPLLALHD